MAAGGRTSFRILFVRLRRIQVRGVALAKTRDALQPRLEMLCGLFAVKGSGHRGTFPLGAKDR